MPELRIIKDPSYGLWNVVLNLTEGNCQQTFEHAEMKRKYDPRIKPIRVLAISDGNPVGVVQGVYRCRFGFGSKMIVGGVSGGAPITCVNKEGERRHVTGNLLKAFEKYARKKRVIECRVFWPESWGMLDMFHELGYRCVREINVVNVDLNKSVEDLWNSISSNKRKNIRKAMKLGVEVEEGENLQDLLSFYRMLEASGRRAGFSPSSLGEIGAMWAVYRPKNMVNLFFAKWKNQRVAGVITLMHVKTVFAIAAGSIQAAWIARPNDLLHCKVMEWACERGFVKYNLGAVSDPVPDAAFDGLWRWKRGFKPILEKFHNFEKVYLPNVKRILAPIHKMFGNVLKA